MTQRSPEEYFRQHDFGSEAATGGGGEFTAAERAFMQKYLGVEEGDLLRRIGIDPVRAGGAGGAGAAGAAAGLEDEAESLDARLRNEPVLQMVGFFLGAQEFAVPTEAVQEVIKYAAPTRLPAAPSFVAGIVNLRGRVTPLVRLRELLGVYDGGDAAGSEDRFIIVCRRRGLQMGMMIERVHTMYRVPQQDIDWAIESHLGISVDFVSGLLKADERLISIVSVDKILDCVLKR
ncbi:chemotaxis protein CheW [Nitratidesulfovibrio sp. SRB-5]|uniref:chemotaxis protein CheW n=1 Tax=Nitratidesulfovibrio sp. SRB-5 TaxID=2872636 RepID=UPI001027C7C2|nr:chemotaxis protein CheW [Nitratidesulfovibrio sp. SRB-5]MBZ2172909.1 chemotaxis protein CheW [Nitratidesulfovibrio sp. SRB-5]RXF76942.1 purine-binding chemotaxis protein CheW [Desulfovibrio sp. DS-1]